jgi:inner membrane protein
MDSLSQIVLGAAVGEVVLGRRIGNRAMVWGAVAGTIPDMDVLGGYFLSELDNLAFHRGISHSLLATVLGALAFGWATDRLYRSRHHAWIAMGTKAAAAVVIGFVVNFLTQIFAPGAWLPVALYVPLVGAWWWRHGQRRYFGGTWEAPDADLRG